MRPTSQLPMGVGVLLLSSADGGVMAALDHGVTNKAQSPNKHGCDRTKLSCKKQKNIDVFPYLAMTPPVSMMLMMLMMMPATRVEPFYPKIVVTVLALF